MQFTERQMFQKQTLLWFFDINFDRFLDKMIVSIFSQREYEHGVQDCDSALCVSEGSRRALYRKALCLREMGRFREAYECGTRCLLTAPHVGL